MGFYENNTLSASKALFEAQKIAFAPFVFQATRALRDLKILQTVEDSGKNGVTLEEIVDKLDISEYGIKVLIEAGLGIGLFLLKENKYTLTKTGYFILHDEMTRINMDFVQDINYLGFYNLKESIQNGKPEGLKVLGPWKTLYEGLSILPEGAKKSWFDFDHFYSDNAFKQVLPIVFKDKPGTLLDVGGNTGKWSIQCTTFDPDVKVTIADLPGQLRMAENNITQHGLADRINFHAINLLNPSEKLPKGNNVIWMSQFLDCFSQDEIVSILSRAHEAMEDEDQLFILETYWNRQKYEASAFCLQQTSLYFTCIANGNSQMYHSDDMKNCLEKAGLKVLEEIDGIGISHTLFKCGKK
ncbi:MAG: methyltransferase domain-containing protein [Opitutaceae bacterium]|nr:methyltransferase domain-containing protein [Cytophagales bacterium]